MALIEYSGKVVLASMSSRRQALLKYIFDKFEVLPTFVDESKMASAAASPVEVVTLLARAKCEEASNISSDALVIAADTIVVCGGEILNKPKEATEARTMLQKLSGTTHSVLTGVAIAAPAQETLVFVDESRVTFRKLSAAEIEQYIATKSPFDKAGAYGIQDSFGATAVLRIEGSFESIMGLPVARLAMILMPYCETTSSGR